VGLGRQLGDGRHARGSELFHRARGGRVGEVRRHQRARRLLAVRGVAARLVVDDVVIAHLGRHHELVGEAPAHHARVSLDRNRLDAQTPEEACVGLLHREVAAHRALVAGVERVGVHHDELARPHKSIAGADLVPKLGSDLIKVLGQVPVAGDLRLHQRGDDLLVGRTENNLRLRLRATAGARAVGAEHDLARRSPAGALRPEIGGVQMRHPQLNRAGAIHLLTTELGNLVHRTQAQREVGVKAAPQPAHQPSADKQAVRGDLRIGGGVS